MTGSKLLLDTNIVIELFKGDMQIAAVLEEQEKVFIPVVVLGELYLGAYRSGSLLKKLEEVKLFLPKCVVLNVDNTTAENYGIIKTALLNKGKPIPENDIWIASIAQQYKLPLYTKDVHFTEVESIQVI